MTKQDLLELFKENDSLIITTHESPDGDAIGSEIALALGLISLGKNVFVINEDPCEKRYEFLYRHIQIHYPNKIKDSEIPIAAPLLVLDTLPDNTGKNMQEFQNKVEAVYTIDHHDTNDEAQLPQGYYQSDASSTSEIVFDVLTALDVIIDIPMGEAIFTGMVYDTGSFQYKKTGAHTLWVASKLVESGVNPFRIHTLVNQSNTKESLVLLSKVLGSLEFYSNDRIAVLTMPREMLLESGANFEESQTMINIALSCFSVEVSTFFKQDEKGLWKCSLRSKGHFNCLDIAEFFGGGGHSTAAGFKIHDSIDEIRTKVLESIGQLLS